MASLFQAEKHRSAKASSSALVTRLQPGQSKCTFKWAVPSATFLLVARTGKGRERRGHHTLKLFPAQWGWIQTGVVYLAKPKTKEKENPVLTMTSQSAPFLGVI